VSRLERNLKNRISWLSRGEEREEREEREEKD
jgi:hypothetical protein